LTEPGVEPLTNHYDMPNCASIFQPSEADTAPFAHSHVRDLLKMPLPDFK